MIGDKGTRDNPLTLDDIWGTIKELDAQMSDVVARFVGHPDTVDEFLTLARSAGVEFKRVDDPLSAVTGIPFHRDHTMRRGWIEGRNHRGDRIRVFALVVGRLYEYTDIAQYELLVLGVPSFPSA